MSRHAPCHRKVSGKVWFSPDQGEQSRPGGSPQESLAALEGHNDCAWSVALGRIGGRDVAVSGGEDGTVRVWDAASGESLTALGGHKGWVFSVALGRTAGRDVAVSGGEDGTVRVWDAASGESLAALEGHKNGVRSVALGRIGGRDVAVSGGLDGTVRLQDVEGALTDAKSLLQHQLILGRGPGAFMELVADGAGGHRIARSSPDVWRHFIAKGWTPDGHMVMAPIEEMMTADALAVALAAARGQ